LSGSHLSRCLFLEETEEKKLSSKPEKCPTGAGNMYSIKSMLNNDEVAQEPESLNETKSFENRIELISALFSRIYYL